MLGPGRAGTRQDRILGRWACCVALHKRIVLAGPGILVVSAADEHATRATRVECGGPSARRNRLDRS